MAYRGFPITSRDPRRDPRKSDRDHEMSLRDLLSTSEEKKNGEPSLALQLAEAFGGALLAGLAVGRINHWNIPGTPIPIGLAGAGAVIAGDLLGWIPRGVAKHTTNVAIGAAASWGTMIGAGWGQQMRAGAGEAITPITAGETGHHRPALGDQPPPALGRRPRRLTEAELAALMREAA